MSWTDERVEKLKTLWNEGMSASQIAKDLGGVTRNAVIGKVHRLGLASRTVTKAEAPSEPAAEAVPKPDPVVTAPPEPAAKKAAAPVEAAPVVEADNDDTEDEAATPALSDRAQSLPALPSENAVDIAEIDRSARKLSLMELTERTCKWPIGDPSRGEFYFCGQPAIAGKPYCQGHSSAAYQPMSSRRDRERMRAANRPAITRTI